MTMLRQTQLVVEVLVENTPKLRSTQNVAEALVKNNPPLRVYQLAVESATSDTAAPVRVYQIAIEAIYTETAGTAYEESLSIDGVAGVTLGPGTGYPETLTIAGLSDLTFVQGLLYLETASIEGVSDISLATQYGIGGSLTIAGVADLAFLASFDSNFTVGAVCGFGAEVAIDYQGTLTLAAISQCSSPGGLVINISQPIEGLAAITLMPGTGYQDTLNIEGVADFTIFEQTYLNEVLSVEGVCDFAAETQSDSAGPLTIGGVASCTIGTELDMVDSVIFAGGAEINIENYYDLLYVTAVYSGFDVAVVGRANHNQNPSSAGSFSATCSGVFNRTVTQSLTITQTLAYAKPNNYPTNTLSFTQSATYTRTRNETVEQTFVMTQEAEAVRGLVQALTINQTATCIKVISRTITQTLTLTQEVERQAILSRTISDTLVFNVPRLRTAPIVGSQGGGDQTQFQYYQPLIQVALKPVNCLVVLGVPTQTVILPCPAFGDSQSYTGEINLKKTMTGDTFTYVKKTETEMLKYTFNIGTYKAIELRAFLLAHSHELITLHNWKGETWYVFLVNNPFEFTHSGRWQPKGERVDITLEFEGIRR